jgi:nitrogen fixation protein
VSAFKKVVVFHNIEHIKYLYCDITSRAAPKAVIVLAAYETCTPMPMKPKYINLLLRSRCEGVTQTLWALKPILSRSWHFATYFDTLPQDTSLRERVEHPCLPGVLRYSVKLRTLPQDTSLRERVENKNYSDLAAMMASPTQCTM